MDGKLLVLPYSVFRSCGGERGGGREMGQVSGEAQGWWMSVRVGLLLAEWMVFRTGTVLSFLL